MSEKSLAFVSKLYRLIPIAQEDVNLFVIVDNDEKRFEFTSWDEACAFVDAWYAARYMSETVYYIP